MTLQPNDAQSLRIIDSGLDSLPTSDVAASISSGTFIGDSSANKAILHNLGKKPLTVSLISSSENNLGGIIIGTTIQNYYAGNKHSLTEMDDTYFYVGNATNYTESGNLADKTYLWVAQG